MLKWYWKVAIQPRLYYAAAFLTTCMSLLLVWSEVTFSVESPTLSVYALVIGVDGHDAKYLALELVSFLTLFYLCICTFRVVFTLGILSFYYVVPKQQTDSTSLLYSAMFLSRLTVPLCLNFLSMSHLDSHVTSNNVIHIDTAFTRVRRRRRSRACRWATMRSRVFSL